MYMYICGSCTLKYLQKKMSTRLYDKRMGAGNTSHAGLADHAGHDDHVVRTSPPGAPNGAPMVAPPDAHAGARTSSAHQIAYKKQFTSKPAQNSINMRSIPLSNITVHAVNFRRAPRPSSVARPVALPITLARCAALLLRLA